MRSVYTTSTLARLAVLPHRFRIVGFLKCMVYITPTEDGGLTIDISGGQYPGGTPLLCWRYYVNRVAFVFGVMYLTIHS